MLISSYFKSVDFGDKIVLENSVVHELLQLAYLSRFQVNSNLVYLWDNMHYNSIKIVMLLEI